MFVVGEVTSCVLSNKLKLLTSADICIDKDTLFTSCVYVDAHSKSGQ